MIQASEACGLLCKSETPNHDLEPVRAETTVSILHIQISNFGFLSTNARLPSIQYHPANLPVPDRYLPTLIGITEG